MEFFSFTSACSDQHPFVQIKYPVVATQNAPAHPHVPRVERERAGVCCSDGGRLASSEWEGNWGGRRWLLWGVFSSQTCPQSECCGLCPLDIALTDIVPAKDRSCCGHYIWAHQVWWTHVLHGLWSFSLVVSHPSQRKIKKEQVLNSLLNRP